MLHATEALANWHFRVERKERARLKNVKFQGKGQERSNSTDVSFLYQYTLLWCWWCYSLNLFLCSSQQLMGTSDRKKKNFSFSRKFPFMKSKDHSGSEDAISADEREYRFVSSMLYFLSWFSLFGLTQAWS